MPTPAIQTLINDAQQVLNLDSISAVRSVVAVSLANANTGTPLNPNLTTQQLWNEFYQVVTRSKSDIESIIANQLMKFLYSPPAPGGVGADKQVIFNDNGILAGDAGLTYDKATDSLTVLGSLGVGTSPTGKLTIGTGAYVAGTLSGTSSLYSTVGQGLVVLADGLVVGTRTGSDRFILDSSGNVGIGVVPSAWNWAGIKALEIGYVGNGFLSWASSETYLLSNTYYNSGFKYGTAVGASYYRQLQGVHSWHTNSNSPSAGGSATFTTAMTLDASGNLLVGTTTMPSGVTFARLVAKSTSGDWSGVIWNSNATPYGFRIQHDTDSNGTGNEFLYCLGGANLRASIRSNGGIANYQANDVSLSDSRLKTDIKPLASYWNKIKSLELVTFKYKDQTHSDDNIGLIAQQVESVAPELVDVDGFGETPDDGVPLKTIYTTDLYHAAIKALQEAMTRIEALEAKLA